MSISHFINRARQKLCITVVLQGEQVFWFKWRQHELVDTFVEAVSLDAVAAHIRCPWIHVEEGETPLTVELVLNTALDELDRVKTETATSSFIRHVHRRRLLNCLSEDYPHASTFTLPRFLEPDVISILHHIIPEPWEFWLKQLQQQGVYITQVVTGTELLLSSTRYQHKGPGFYAMPMGVEIRHILVDGCCPLFMRVLSATPLKELEVPDQEDKNIRTDDSSQWHQADLEALRETLSYIKESILTEPTDVPVLVPDCNWPAQTKELSAARLVAELSIGHRIHYRAGHLNELQGFDDDRLSGECKGSATTKLEPIPSVTSSLRSLFEHCSLWANKQRWRVAKSGRLATAVLQPSVHQIKQYRRITQLQHATIMCAALAAVTVAVASVHGIKSARVKARIAHEQEQLGQHIHKLSDSVLALHPSPEFVTRSVHRIENYQDTRPMEPYRILSTVAMAITDFPALVLNRLSWTALEEGAVFDANNADPLRVVGRHNLWNVDSLPTQIQIELSGAVISDKGLRDQQSALDAFVSYLQDVPGISRVNVLEAPVHAAQSSDRLLDEHSSYRVALLLGAL